MIFNQIFPLMKVSYHNHNIISNILQLFIRIFCPYCRHQNSQFNKYCTNCGKTIEIETSQKNLVSIIISYSWEEDDTRVDCIQYNPDLYLKDIWKNFEAKIKWKTAGAKRKVIDVEWIGSEIAKIMNLDKSLKENLLKEREKGVLKFININARKYYKADIYHKEKFRQPDEDFKIHKIIVEHIRNYLSSMQKYSRVVYRHKCKGCKEEVFTQDIEYSVCLICGSNLGKNTIKDIYHVESPVPPKNIPEVICSRCGSKNFPHIDKYCTKCGNSII